MIVRAEKIPLLKRSDFKAMVMPLIKNELDRLLRRDDSVKLLRTVGCSGVRELILAGQRLRRVAQHRPVGRRQGDVGGREHGEVRRRRRC